MFNGKIDFKAISKSNQIKFYYDSMTGQFSMWYLSHTISQSVTRFMSARIWLKRIACVCVRALPFINVAIGMRIPVWERHDMYCMHSAHCMCPNTIKSKSLILNEVNVLYTDNSIIKCNQTQWINGCVVHNTQYAYTHTHTHK